jgi:hypothetical protein
VTDVDDGPDGLNDAAFDRMLGATPTVAELDAGLPALEAYLVAELPGCTITNYQHYLLVSLAGANSGVRTREQAERAVLALRAHAAKAV